MSFSGAVWGERPVVQVLTVTLPMHYNYSDTDLQGIIARHLGGLKKTVEWLHEYYKRQNTWAASGPLAPFPYPMSFVSRGEDATAQPFTYKSRLNPDKLLFIGQLQTGKRICIKFARQYSHEVHDFCAAQGFAPVLLGLETLAGGWYMAFMDAIDGEYQDMTEKPERTTIEGLAEKITMVHQHNFVHRDIRAANVMVRKDGGEGFMLVDFEWAGVIGRVKYPANVNTVDIKRPEGALDGRLITAAHDMAMLGYMLDGDA